MSQKPTSVLVLSILGLIYGGILFLFTAVGLVMNTFHLGPSNPMLKDLENDSLLKVFNIVGGCIGVLLLGMLIAGSIGSLKLKNWARVTMLVWAGLAIVQDVLGTILAFTYVMPLVTKSMAAIEPRAAHYAMIFASVSGICGGLLQLILPILILFFFTRLKVVNAFKGIFEASPTNFPVDYQQPPQA